MVHKSQQAKPTACEPFGVKFGTLYLPVSQDHSGFNVPQVQAALTLGLASS